MNRCRFAMLLVVCASLPAASAPADRTLDSQTYRLYPGIVAYVNNPTGHAFDLSIDLRDWNVFAAGPREVLLKVAAKKRPAGIAVTVIVIVAPPSLLDIVEADGIHTDLYCAVNAPLQVRHELGLVVARTPSPVPWGSRLHQPAASGTSFRKVSYISEPN